MSGLIWIGVGAVGGFGSACIGSRILIEQIAHDFRFKKDEAYAALDCKLLAAQSQVEKWKRRFEMARVMANSHNRYLADELIRLEAKCQAPANQRAIECELDGEYLPAFLRLQAH